MYLKLSSLFQKNITLKICKKFISQLFLTFTRQFLHETNKEKFKKTFSNRKNNHLNKKG